MLPANNTSIMIFLSPVKTLSRLNQERNMSCFYQWFKLLFWRHPFTAEDPLVRKRCNAKSFKICSNKETNSFTSWKAWGRVIFQHDSETFICLFLFVSVFIFRFPNSHGYIHTLICINELISTENPEESGTEVPSSSSCAVPQHSNNVTSITKCNMSIFNWLKGEGISCIQRAYTLRHDGYAASSKYTRAYQQLMAPKECITMLWEVQCLHYPFITGMPCKPFSYCTEPTPARLFDQPPDWLTLCWVTDGLTGGLLEGKSIILWSEWREL